MLANRFMPTRVALVDDNSVNRNTFARKIGSFDDLQIVFTSAKAEDCLEKLKELPQEKLPQVLFVDLEMPGMNGIQLIQIAKVLYPSIHLIVLTIFDDDERIFDAIRSGADGYLLKDDNPIALRNAITNSVEEGGAPMSASIARKTLDMLSRSIVKTNGPQPSDDSLTNLLSAREKEILQCTIKGLSPSQIADTLFISVYTVRKHIANIYEKLHVNSNSQIMTLAYKHKWG